eukprot:scaffold1318_cov388-Prasinococcus_capsulatus_cf.AAC.13
MGDTSRRSDTVVAVHELLLGERREVARPEEVGPLNGARRREGPAGSARPLAKPPTARAGEAADPPSAHARTQSGAESGVVGGHAASGRGIERHGACASRRVVVHLPA